MAFIMFSALDQQFRHQRRPAGLMAGAHTGAGVAVEVLVEWNQVAPQGVGLKEIDPAKHWSTRARVLKKNKGQPT
jgi:hypothetical protein